MHLLIDELSALSALPPQPRRWLYVMDANGAALVEAVEGVRAHEALGGLVARGAQAAAFISLNATPTWALTAYVRVAQPPNSDVRRATVDFSEAGASVGPWEYTV